MRYLIFFIPLLVAATLATAQKKVPKYIREHITNCYTGKPTQLRQLLNIDGYYEEVWLRPWSSGYGKHKEEGDSFKLYMLFYDDGTFVYNLMPHTPRDYNKYVYMKECEYLQAAYKDPIKYRFYIQSQWGIYKLKQDTLIMQSIHPRGSMNDDPWFALERKYKVVDKNTIQRIRGGIKYLSKVREPERIESYQQNLRDDSLPARFIPCMPIPPPDCWLKQEDWLWCKDKVEK